MFPFFCKRLYHLDTLLFQAGFTFAGSSYDCPVPWSPFDAQSTPGYDVKLGYVASLCVGVSLAPP